MTNSNKRLNRMIAKIQEPLCKLGASYGGSPYAGLSYSILAAVNDELGVLEKQFKLKGAKNGKQNRMA